jgi:hypothetical protein
MNVALIVHPRRLKINVVNLVPDRAIPPPRQPLFQNRGGHINQNRGQGLALRGREPFKHLRLHDRARETIQHITVKAIVMRGPLPDHFNHDVIGYQHTGRLRRVNVLCGQCPQHVAGRYLRQA